MIALMLMFTSNVFGEAIDVNLKKSHAVWTGTKVTGSHTGKVTVKSAKLMREKGNLSSVNVVMDMTSITTTDITGEYATKLVNHLRSPDFFDVENHKVASFKSDAFEAKGKNTYILKGDLEVKGKKQQISMTVNKKGDVYVANFTFDRTKHGIKYGSGSFFKGLGDKLIHDEVKVEMTLATK